MTENKMEKLKNRFAKLQEKIQDRVEDFQESVQSKIENSKLSKIVSRLSDDRSSVDDNSSIDGKDRPTGIVNDRRDTSSESGFVNTDKEERKFSIPSLIINDSNEELNKDPREICKDFLKIETNSVLYKRLSVSTSNLKDDKSDISSVSCVSCISSSDDRYFNTYYYILLLPF